MPKIVFHINAILVLMNNLRDKKVLEQFGQKLKDLRLQKGLTLEQLAFEAVRRQTKVNFSLVGVSC